MRWRPLLGSGHVTHNSYLMLALDISHQALHQHALSEAGSREAGLLIDSPFAPCPLLDSYACKNQNRPHFPSQESLLVRDAPWKGMVGPPPAARPTRREPRVLSKDTERGRQVHGGPSIPGYCRAAQQKTRIISRGGMPSLSYTDYCSALLPGCTRPVSGGHLHVLTPRLSPLGLLKCSQGNRCKPASGDPSQLRECPRPRPGAFPHSRGIRRQVSGEQAMGREDPGPHVCSKTCFGPQFAPASKLNSNLLPAGPRGEREATPAGAHSAQPRLLLGVVSRVLRCRISGLWIQPGVPSQLGCVLAVCLGFSPLPPAGTPSVPVAVKTAPPCVGRTETEHGTQ